MKKIIFLAVAFIVSILSMHAEVKYMTTAMFKEQVLDYTKDSTWNYLGKRPCIIDFYTTWCGPCKRLAPIMEELSEQYKNKIDFYKIDTEREREVAMVFGISSIPQVLYVPMKGKPTLTKGLVPKENIVSIIEQAILGKKKKQ